MICVSPEASGHKEALDMLFGPEKKEGSAPLRNLRMRCVGGAADYDFKWPGLTTL